MPTLNVNELNVVLALFGAFMSLYGLISVKIKMKYYLGEALPAVVSGIILGPISAKYLSATPEQLNHITLGITRVVIGVQLVIVGFQLPAKYQKQRWLEMAVCMLPLMVLMWLFTTACIILTVPKISPLAALVIGSCVTSTDPVLSQAIAKGDFADNYVPRALRELISSEAGGNDGSAFPLLMLATFLIRHAEGPDTTGHAGAGRLGGGIRKALEQWVIEAWLYLIVMAIAYGIVVGYSSRLAVKFSLRKKWIDCESYLLWPTFLGLFIVGTCGALGSNDLLACFVAGNALNWDGQYLAETETQHDRVNSCIDFMLNFGGFMYIGSIIPWREFQLPDVTGITVARLMLLGFLLLIFRRIPAMLFLYKAMPKVVKSWKEALFMGYFGPMGIGAVFYVEYGRQLFPKPGEGDEEQNNLTAAMTPVVYWLVLFSIIVHGLSIPLLNLFYKWRGVEPIQEEAIEVHLLSQNQPLPSNATRGAHRNSIIYHNKFTRPQSPRFRWPKSVQLMYFRKSQETSEETLPVVRPLGLQGINLV